MSHDQGDPSDLEFIAQELSYLRQKLSRRYGLVDPHLLDASIEDALLHYLRSPECFDASRGAPLESYLLWRTRHYLDKRLRKVRCRRKREKTVGVLEINFEQTVSEVRGERGIYVGRDRSEQEAEEQEEEIARERTTLDAIVSRLDSRDRAEVRLLLAGASGEEWVRHLGIEHLPHKEQLDEVNGEKDRLKKKLKRRAQKMQGGGSHSIGVRVRAIEIGADRERESWQSQLRMLQSREVDGSGERMRCSASCSLLSVCCCW